MTVIQQGSVNTTALVVPDLYVQIVPPQNLVLNGVPTNVVGVVGSAPWGPVGTPQIVGTMSDYATYFGSVQARTGDMGTQVATAVQQGASNFRCVRVTDGSDVAASALFNGTASSNCSFIATSRYTGSGANSDTLTFNNGSRSGSYKLTVARPGLQPEVYDNILAGIYTNTVTVGTGATSVPALTFSAPNLTGGTQATGSVSLATTGTPTVGAGGTGYAIGDTITLANGVVVKVATINSGAILTFVAQGTAGTSAGSITGVGTAVPANPCAQVSTSGSGTGATVNLTWGLGTVTMQNNGLGYTSATCTVGSTGGSGTVAPVTSYWGSVVNAVNLGNGPTRGASQLVTLTAGAGTNATASPTGLTLPMTITLGTGTGSVAGTDGVANLTSAGFIGVDTVPRTGMYALRSQGCSIGLLADVTDSTQWTTEAAFGLSEGIYMITVSPSGDTISNAVTAKGTAGLDSYAVKHMFGDWLYWNDQTNGIIRLVSPQGFVAGRLANLSPEQSSLNKQLYSVAGSQKSGLAVSGQGGAYANADLQTLFQAGIDVISNPQPGGKYWGVRLGHNSSSNPAINGDNYTRLTNYIAATLNGGMGLYVGQVINSDLFNNIRSTLLSFLQNLLGQGILGSLDGSLPFSVICDTSNNPLSRTSLGYVQADVAVQYQGINEKFIVNVQGGQTVTVTKQTLPSGQASS